MAGGAARRPSLAAEAGAYAEAMLAAVLVALFFRTWVVEAFNIPSGSMEPGLLPGDHIVVNKFLYGRSAGPWGRLLPGREPARGDVVVFRSPAEPARDLVKRFVGLPGETVEIAAKRLVVDGSVREEPYAVHRDPDVLPKSPDVPKFLATRDHFGPVRLGAGEFLALGDNRDDSQDSRVFGPVPRGLLKGRAVLVYWSFEAGAAGEVRGRGAGLRRFLDNALHFFERTRWARTGRPVR
ncbi:MAG TPA: signal peptidase I [Thermoanaerobaculia bacterium]|nr:signal peptidase I [Thermoanaerobaculia bacterium]